MIVRTSERALSFSISRNAHTLAGFRIWAASDSFPDHGCIALIQGELLIDICPERAESHNAVKTEVSRALLTLVGELDLGNFYSDGMWITHDAAALSSEPDALVATWEILELGCLELIVDEEMGHGGIELRGSPDWVFEVVSPNSVRKDLQLLPDAYFPAKVREYWLIDARGELLQCTTLARGDQGFVALAPHDGWTPSQGFPREFRLKRERNRLGGWRYTLQMREGKSNG